MTSNIVVLASDIDYTFKEVEQVKMFLEDSEAYAAANPVASVPMGGEGDGEAAGDAKAGSSGLCFHLFLHVHAFQVRCRRCVHLLLLCEFGNPLLALGGIFDPKLLDPTDPEAAPTDSIRDAVLAQWEELGSIRFGVSVNSSRALQLRSPPQLLRGLWLTP